MTHVSHRFLVVSELIQYTRGNSPCMSSVIPIITPPSPIHSPLPSPTNMYISLRRPIHSQLPELPLRPLTNCFLVTKSDLSSFIFPALRCHSSFLTVYCSSIHLSCPFKLIQTIHFFLSMFSNCLGEVNFCPVKVNTDCLSVSPEGSILLMINSPRVPGVSVPLDQNSVKHSQLVSPDLSSIISSSRPCLTHSLTSIFPTFKRVYRGIPSDPLTAPPPLHCVCCSQEDSLKCPT